MIRYAGLILCLIVLIGAMNIIGADIFIDALSFLLVAIGAIGYALLRQMAHQLLQDSGMARYILAGLAQSSGLSLLPPTNRDILQILNCWGRHWQLRF